MTELNKDVVGARINLDTSKMLQGFKIIDDGARKNAESFQKLNKELVTAEKNYISLARAMEKASSSSSKTATNNSRDSLNQARLDRELQQLKSMNARIEMEAERHAARLQRISQASNSNMSQTPVNSNGLLDRIGSYAQHAFVFHAITSAINTAQHALKEGLVDIEYNMAGYVQTNEHYFLEFKEGTHEAAMNTQKLHEETTRFIQTAHALGSKITEVTESARLWGRMYKDVNIVQELVRQSTMLSTVDMVSLEDATKSMESVMAQYGVQIQNANDAMVLGNRVLDSWSKVAHDTMAPAKDLGAAFERTGKIAAETGVSFDFMNGLMSSGIRNTALGGANLGNMWKTVLGTIRTDKAVAEIERLGVKTKELVDGTEQWRKAEDILLDLSTKVIDKNYDLTQSYADISRGVYQFSKLAASLNAGDILLGTAASIGSTGSTIDYLKVQMDTIQRKAAQTKTSLLEIFNNAGDDGLRSSIKGALDVLDQLLIGLSKVPKGTFEAAAGIAGLIALYKMMAPLLIQWRQAQVALNTAVQIHSVVQSAATREMVMYTAAARSAAVTTAAWTAGITLAIGLIATYIFTLGSAEKAERERIQSLKDEDSVSQQRISQYERQIELLPKLVNAHQSLKSSLDSGSLSAEKQVQVKKQLDEVSKALVITLGEEGARQLDAANYTDQAVQVQIAALNGLIAKQQEARKNVLEDQKVELYKQQKEKTEELIKAREKLNSLEGDNIGSILESWKALFKGKSFEDAGKAVDALREKVKELEQETNKLTEASAGIDVQLGQIAVGALDQFSGSAGKSTESTKELESKLSDLKEEIKGNGGPISELNSLLHGLSEGQSINAANAADLILKYPELAANIYKVGDGWNFEKDAVELLRKAKIQKAIDDLKAEKESLQSTIDGTNQRMEAYGLEMKSIKDLAEFKQKMNGVGERKQVMTDFANSPSILGDAAFDPQQYIKDQTKASIEEEDRKVKEIEESYGKYFDFMKGYQDKVSALTKLYNDPNFGVSNKGAGKKAGSKDDPLEKAFNASQKWIDHQKAMGKMDTSQELAAWERVQAQYAKGTEQRMKADEKVYALKKTLLDETTKKEKQAFTDSMNWIAHQKAIREVSASEELTMLLRVQARYKEGSELRKQLDEKVYTTKKAMEQEFFSNYQKNLSHLKAIGQLNTEDELQAWIKLQNMYKEGTEQRMQADEQVYSASQKLQKEKEKSIEEFTKNHKKKIVDTRKLELDAIDEAKRKFVEAQDEKIAAIDRLLQKMQEMNEDEDYEAQLRKKEARAELLKTAVGPEGIKERRELLEEIERMKLEHNRTLQKRDLEAQKKALEEEKKEREKAFEEEKRNVNDKFDSLTNAFENFQGEVQTIEDAIKDFRVKSNQETNNQILTDLDNFIAEYKAKQASISSLSQQTEKESDLIRYNANIDKWYATTDPKEKAAAHAENEELRKKYGIKKDTGKLQHFDNGGVVQGRRGEAVPVIAHAGEVFINESQQSNLLKLLNFSMPKINYAAPNFEAPKANVQYIKNHFDMSAGDLSFADGGDVKGFFSERENLVKRIRSKGVKTR